MIKKILIAGQEGMVGSAVYRLLSNSKNLKMVLGIGGIALVIIIIIAVSFNGISNVTPTIDTPTNSISDTLTIQIDSKNFSYANKDIIAINGVSDTLGTVNLSIENQNNELVWAEQVSLKSDGRYSTLAIAGGLGWENPGTYTIKVDNGVETKSNTFSFTV